MCNAKALDTRSCIILGLQGGFADLDLTHPVDTTREYSHASNSSVRKLTRTRARVASNKFTAVAGNSVEQGGFWITAGLKRRAWLLR